MRPTAPILAAALLLVALALPAAAAAEVARERSGAAVAPVLQPDGILTIRSANGVLTLSGRGSVIGQSMGKGRLLIEDADLTDGVPVVSGYDRAQRQSRFAILYSGTDLRFRVLGGQFKLRLVASGVSLSFVGKGTATLLPAGSSDDGWYSLDGGDTYRPFGLMPMAMTVTGGLAGQPPLPSGLGPDRP